MKKVLFFSQNRWAFGSIHHALSKELYSYGIIANLLDWTQQYTPEEFSLLNDTYDLFLTMPEAVVPLSRCGIPLEKICAVAHGQWDMLLARQQFGVDFFNQIAGFGVVSDILKSKAQEFGIPKIPEVLTMGVHFDLFYRKPSDYLHNVGYAGAKETKNFFGEEIKRGHLVKEVVSNLPDFNLVEHSFYNWMCMPGYYGKVDAVVISSTEESAGLPSMEAAAAGRLVLSTPVGYFEEHGELGGELLPLETEGFKKQLQYKLQLFEKYPDIYRKRCKQIQEYASHTYDWRRHIGKWVDWLSLMIFQKRQ
jgi:hypothetical protein